MSTDPAENDLCTCPGAQRMGRSQGVNHADHRVPCDECGRMVRYCWVISGRHLCGRCLLYGPGDQG